MKTQSAGRSEQRALKERNYEDFKQWLRERFGGEPKQLDSRLCIRRLIPGTRHRATVSSPCECLPPMTDHPSLWAVNGKVVAFVSEPYQWNWPDPAIPDERRDELIRWAEELGLEVEISDKSWWNPPLTGRGGTVLVVFTVKGAAPGERR